MSRTPESDPTAAEAAHSEPASELGDPLGWCVVSADGVRMGEVCALVPTDDADGAGYLDCELDADVLDLHDDRRVLVPLAETRLDPGMEQVLVLRLTRDDLIQLPGDDAEGEAAASRVYDDVLRSRRPPRARPPLRRAAGWPAVGYGDDM